MTMHAQQWIAKIAAYDDDDFRDLVDRDLRRENMQEEADALRSPALVDRWYAVLVGMLKSVDGQLAARREDFEVKRQRLRQEALATTDEADIDRVRREIASLREQHAKTRAATLRFKSGLEETLVEARAIRNRLRDRLYETVVTEERNRLAEELRETKAQLAHLQAEFKFHTGKDITDPKLLNKDRT